MTYKDSTPTFNVNRKIVNYKDFIQHEPQEEAELKKMKRQFKKADGVKAVNQDHQSKYNKVTHKNDDLVKAEVEDKLDALESKKYKNRIMKILKTFESWNRTYFSAIKPRKISDWTEEEIYDLENLGAEDLTNDSCIFRESNDLVVTVNKSTKTLEGNHPDFTTFLYKAKSNRTYKSSRIGGSMVQTNSFNETDWFSFLKKLNELITSDGIIKSDRGSGFDL